MTSSDPASPSRWQPHPGDNLPNCLTPIAPILRAANQIKEENPGVAYLCRLAAYEKVHYIDPTSIGAGVQEWKSDMALSLKTDEEKTKVESMDVLEELQKFCEQYRRKNPQDYETVSVLCDVLNTFTPDDSRSENEMQPQHQQPQQAWSPDTSDLFRFSRRPPKTSGFWTWCYLIMVPVVLAGLVAFMIMMLVVAPTPPRITVGSAHLGSLAYDGGSTMDGKLSLGLVTKNLSPRVAIVYSDLSVRLLFHKALLNFTTLESIDVPRQTSRWVNTSVLWHTALDVAGRAELQASLNKGRVRFTLSGRTRATLILDGHLILIRRWKMLSCELFFYLPSGEPIGDFDCHYVF